MAHRVATEYVNVNLTVPEADLPRLFGICESQQLKLQVFIFENGNQEFAMEDGVSGESIRITFERMNGDYRCRLTCRVVQPKLTNALRRMVQIYRGDAVVNRIYAGFTMVYHYRQGSVVRIAECKDGTVRTVFEHRDTLGLLEAQFKLCSVEEEISRLKQSINDLLDRRNLLHDSAETEIIDERLKLHGRLLFTLEA